MTEAILDPTAPGEALGGCGCMTDLREDYKNHSAKPTQSSNPQNHKQIKRLLFETTKSTMICCMAINTDVII